MIDLLKAKQEFQNYVNKFDHHEPRNELKIYHTYQVMEMSKYIASDLKLSKEDIELAELIALLHDIGRFKQLEKYETFNDCKSIDHADFGIKLLFEEDLIRQFIEDTQYNSIIQKAIQNHNKYQIDIGLSEKELLHAKIIRDADKVDNFYIKNNVDFKIQYGKTQIGDQLISDKVYQSIREHHCVLLEDRKTNMDEWVSYLAWIFDFNFVSGLKLIMEKGYVNKLINRVEYINPETKRKMKIIEKEITEYMQEAIKKNII